MAASLQEGDAPAVQELLLEHFRDPRLEVEGKLGRRSGSKDKFSSGVTAEQFAELTARLRAGLPAFGLAASPVAPDVEVTVDRFHEVNACAETPGRARGSCKGSALRSSFACDASGQARAEPFEVLNKTRLSDCHIGRLYADGVVHVHGESPVDLRVSFSLEIAVPPSLVEGAPLVYERCKHRQTFLAELFCIQLTHVSIGGERETFEVEVELRMDVAARRIEQAEAPGHEALVITRELVAVMRELSKRASEIPVGKKRKRLEDAHVVEQALLKTVEEPEVETEVRRCVSEGKEALNRAKKYLCGILRHRLPPVDEVALCRIAGRHVSRVLQREMQRSLKGDDSHSSVEAVLV